jgi:hypothetical protein
VHARRPENCFVWRQETPEYNEPSVEDDMKTASNERPISLEYSTWRFQPATARFALRVNHRSGPISYDATVGLADTRLDFDAAGISRVAFTLNGGLKPGDGTEPRLRGVPALHAAGLMKFESSRVTSLGAGRVLVSGTLTTASRTHAIEFELAIEPRQKGLELELELIATGEVDHRILGVWWIPAGPLKTKTTLTAIAPLEPIAHSEQHSARPQRPRRVNDRYRFMAAA